MKKGILVKQHDITDCGAACIASVAAHYKLHLPLARIRQYAGTDARGTNIIGLIEAAEILGFQAKGAKGPFDSLFNIPLPTIAHVVIKETLHHFTVIYRITKKTISIMDPADGKIHKYSHEEFSKIWSGVIVMIVPGADFREGTDRISVTERFWHLLKPHKVMMLQALAGAFIFTLLGLSTSLYVQKIVDFVLVEGNTKLLNLLSVTMIVILIFQLLLGTIKSIFAIKTGQHIDARLILGYYKHLLQLPQRFFDTMRVGEIISRVNDAVKIRLFINDIAINLVVNLLIFVASFSLMFLYYWKLALIMLTIIPIYIVLYFINNSINKKWQRKLMEDHAELETQFVESLHATGTIKQFRLEGYANNKTENRFISLLRSVYHTGVYSIYMGSASEFFTRLFTIIILWSGSYFVINRELSPGELLSFYALIGYFTGPTSSLISFNKNIQEALIAADRLFEIIDLQTEHSLPDTICMTPEMIGDISFKNIHFRYGTRERVFNGLSLHIRKNSHTAIVGESGSGKSTLFALLQHIYPLTEGSISIGGIDIKHISTKSLRDLVSVVPQKIDLFAGTLIENISIGDPHPDFKKILELSEKLGVHEFIEKLPGGYHSLLGEQGVNLSGGQRQKLAILRALYRNPEILILDEPTASLDPASEQKVHETLQWFRSQDKTIIIIAHRLSTIRHCDTILVLENGQLIETGNHEELMGKHGKYKKMWDLII